MIRISLYKKKLSNIKKISYNLFSTYPESWRKLASKELGETKVI